MNGRSEGAAWMEQIQHAIEHVRATMPEPEARARAGSCLEKFGDLAEIWQARRPEVTRALDLVRTLLPSGPADGI